MLFVAMHIHTKVVRTRPMGRGEYRSLGSSMAAEELIVANQIPALLLWYPEGVLHVVRTNRLAGKRFFSLLIQIPTVCLSPFSVSLFSKETVEIEHSLTFISPWLVLSASDAMGRH